MSAWLAARKTVITATQVAEAATPAGFKSALDKRMTDHVEVDNSYMRFGRDNEAWIALYVKAYSGIMPNSWLIRGENPTHAATPDGLSLDHTEIAEIKTGGTEYNTIPRKHVDQMQWQMLCTGAVRCLYAFLLRSEDFQPAWFEPKTRWVERDNERIDFLVDVAGRLYNESMVAA